MTARALWLRFGFGVAAVPALLLVARPVEPPRSPLLAAVAAGAAAGIALFTVIERRPPAIPRAGRLGVRLWLAKHAALAAWAGVEEVAWRWFVLGELARVTPALAALGVSSIVFGVCHRGSSPGRVAAGLAFGTVYLGTGRLLAAWAAHAAYNASIAVTDEALREESPP